MPRRSNPDFLNGVPELLVLRMLAFVYWHSAHTALGRWHSCHCQRRRYAHICEAVVQMTN